MRLFSATLALGITLAASSCVVAIEDNGPIDRGPPRGDLSVSWTFDGYGDCGDVVDVHIVLVDPDGFTYDDSRYDCSLAGVVYEQVDEGWWTIELTGLDVFDRVLYRSETSDVFIEANADNGYDIDLTYR